MLGSYTQAIADFQAVSYNHIARRVVENLCINLVPMLKPSGGDHASARYPRSPFRPLSGKVHSCSTETRAYRSSMHIQLWTDSDPSLKLEALTYHIERGQSQPCGVAEPLADALWKLHNMGASGTPSSFVCQSSHFVKDE